MFNEDHLVCLFIYIYIYSYSFQLGYCFTFYFFISVKSVKWTGKFNMLTDISFQVILTSLDDLLHCLLNQWHEFVGTTTLS